MPDPTYCDRVRRVEAALTSFEGWDVPDNVLSALETFLDELKVDAFDELIQTITEPADA